MSGYVTLVAPWHGHLEHTLELAMKGYRYARDAGDAGGGGAEAVSGAEAAGVTALPGCRPRT